MYAKHQRDYDFPVTLPNGTVITYVEEIEALAAQEAIADGRLPLAPKGKRLCPFGEGVVHENGIYNVSFRDEWIGKYPSLRTALQAWDEAEQYARYQIAVDEELEAINSRFYANVEYDKDGYKVRKK
jgi:hypothetical protein